MNLTWRTWKKGLASVAALGLGATASAQGQVQAPNPIPSVVPAAPSRVIASSQTPPARVPAALPVTQSEPQGMVDLTPPVLPGEHHPTAYHAEPVLHHHLEDTHGQWFATGEYLLWRPRMDGLGYAVVDPVNNYSPTGRVQNLNHDVASGLRVGVGYRLPGHGWDLGITYTYLSSSNDQKTIAPPGGVLYPTFTRPGVVDTATSAVGNAAFDYNVFDLDVGRTWTVDEHFRLRTFGGLRFASIDMDYGARYDGLQAVGSNVTNRFGFEGTGPTAGVAGNWNVTKGFSLLGNARTGLLYGDYSSRVVETNGLAPMQSVLTDLTDNFSGVAPFMSIALGGSYTWRNISLAAGYEVTHYFSLASQPVLVDDFAEGKYVRKRNDLSFDGVFFRLGVTY